MGRCVMIHEAQLLPEHGVSHMQVSVPDRSANQALRAVKNELQRGGVFRKLKLKQHVEKSS
jgi:hypothetical protein